MTCCPNWQDGDANSDREEFIGKYNPDECITECQVSITSPLKLWVDSERVWFQNSGFGILIMSFGMCVITHRTSMTVVRSKVILILLWRAPE